MSINNKRSYTEYTITQPTTDFAIGFDDFDEGGKDNILVTLNGVLVESLGYAAIRKNESTVSITPAITEGTVRLTRETGIDEPFHKFTAGALFSAKSMDENFEQVRHSQQEVRDGFEFLEFNTNGVINDAKAATERANVAADTVEDLVLGKVRTTDVLRPSGLTQEATNLDLYSLVVPKTASITHVEDLGLVGDGIVDNTAVLASVLQLGIPLDFGDSSKVYRITGTVQVQLVAPAHLFGTGATILLDTVAHLEECLTLELAGYDMYTYGTVVLDCAKKSNSGLIVNNTAVSTSVPSVHLVNITVRRCRRVSPTTNGGDGVFIRGLLRKVVLDNPDVRDISMAVGAGVATRQGVFGITVSRIGDTDNQPNAVTINNPYIEDIYSDDPNYVSDQDGLRLFANFGRNELVPNEFSAVVNGGTFKNCNGRSIKSQNEFTKVTGTHFIRTKGFARGYGNDEIDMQVGGGVVENITFSYDGSYASPIVSTHTPRGNLIAKSVGFAAINGVRGSINNIINPSAYVIVSAFVETDIKDVKLPIHNIEILGNVSVDHLLIIKSVTGTITANVKADIQNVVAPLKTSVVYDQMPNNAGSTYAFSGIDSTYITSCDVVKATNPQNIRLSTTNSFTLKTQKRITGLESLQSVTAVDAIVSAKRPDQSGMLTPINFDLPIGTPVTIGDYGYFAGNFMLMFSIAQNANSQAILSVGGGVINLVTAASDVIVGATKPVSGTYKFWLSGNSLIVQNDSSSARKLTGLIIG